MDKDSPAGTLSPEVRETTFESLPTLVRLNSFVLLLMDNLRVQPYVEEVTLMSVMMAVIDVVFVKTVPD